MSFKKTIQHRLFFAVFVMAIQALFAQQNPIKGKVTDSDGQPLPGVTVVLQGQSKAVQTDFDGLYQIFAKKNDKLVFSYVGMATQTLSVKGTTLNVIMQEDSNELDEVVVTALGATRSKKSLGYATQKVKGEQVSNIKDANFVNVLSGKVSGVQINPSGTMGGSTNVIIRGNSSLTGNNQALFIVDGILINNDNNNTSGQRAGRGGYDYGNAAMDINPDDIASINVLKGAAATALYGARAANGVVLITTKKGKSATGAKKLGVSVSSTVTLGNIDKSTFVRYQKEYGAGYGKYYGDYGKTTNSDGEEVTITGYFRNNEFDMDEDGINDEVVPTGEDASYGGRFDPNKSVYQWDSFFPGLANYKKATPWVAAKNTPETFYETAVTTINTVALENASEKGNSRFSYTHLDQKGVLPNSSIKRHTISFGGQLKLHEKLSLDSKITYVNTAAIGRFGTGYDGWNVNQSFRQWYQVNVDIKQQRDAYAKTKRNISWNMRGPDNITRPLYFDNPYWTRYENYQNDDTHRSFGQATLKLKLNNDLSLTSRMAFDYLGRIEEERVAKTSNDISMYRKRIRSSLDLNYDLIVNYNKQFSEEFSLTSLIGLNVQRSKRDNTVAQTSGGLSVAKIYALSNSKNLINAPFEYYAEWGRNAWYANASVGYDDTVFIEGSYRIEKSSTLPLDENVFSYGSVSGSLLFSNLLKADFINFGKLRFGWSSVGNAGPPLSVYNTVVALGSYDGNNLYGESLTQNNPNLKDESTQETEIGLEMQLFDNRLGFDVSLYKRNSIDQIMRASVSTGTGRRAKFVNAGEIENRGIEVGLNYTPIQSKDFSWDVMLNWSANRNEVKSLYKNIQELQLASVQGGISINATVGHPYGTIKGYDFVYKNGKRVVTDDGYYKKTKTKVIIGDVNPDWLAGITNTLKYKNFSLSFLIDIKQGGDFFSLDTWYGFATGIYDRTSFTNDLGKPVRNPLSEGGGVILEGVKEDGSKNDKRVHAVSYRNPWGYKNAVHKEHVYDASFVKLREVSLGYSFPRKLIQKLNLQGLRISATGRNLWIIHKNTPYSDPEAGLSSGNIQGNQSGSYPAVREFSINFNIQF